MIRIWVRRAQLLGAAILLCGTFTSLGSVLSGQATSETSELFAETFDAHWEELRDNYPFFELYGVDWEAEREEHRPRAVAAPNADEFAWELARLIMALPDPHVAFLPSMETIQGLWSYPELDAKTIGRRLYIVGWPEEGVLEAHPKFASDPHACPEIIEICGLEPDGVAEILAAGPLGTTFDIRLRWPDGSETAHELKRPEVSNLPPVKKHFGDKWVVTGRVGSIGYLRVKTFNPELATLGPDGKMTTMLRAALAELNDTEGLILDLQGNGGGQVAASDPFLGNFLKSRISYRWGNADGKRRVIRPRTPRYRGKVVALVDERSASGGEWAARILRDAGRATVIGGRTVGAEAAVHTFEGPDGSVLHYSAWPMVEPGVTPFQETGIELDLSLPLTIEDVRAHGYDAALARARRARLSAALEALGGPLEDLDAFVAIADAADESEESPVAEDR